MTPLFIPLKTEYFEAFKAGTKDTEYRQYGARWNEVTCEIGRRVVLSKGYGKQQRLIGKVIGYATQQMDSPEWIACYKEPGLAAAIRIQIDAEMSGTTIRHVSIPAPRSDR